MRSAATGRGIHGSEIEGGSGLGLAITADIAEAYGATLALDRADIGGLKVILRCPVASRKSVTVPA